MGNKKMIIFGLVILLAVAGFVVAYDSGSLEAELATLEAVNKNGGEI